MLTTVLDGTVFAQRHGAGAVRVLALHGWGRDGTDFDPVLAGYDALALDLPGFGATVAPERPCGTEAYAEQLVPLLRSLGQPVLLGHSFGGRVCARLAGLAPEAIGGIVLTGVPLRPLGTRSRLRPGFRMVRGLRRVGLVSASVLERARQRYGSADYLAAHGVMRDILVRTVAEEYGLAPLAGFADRLAYVWGAQDQDVPPQVAHLCQAETGGTVHTVPGAGHLLSPPLVTALRDTLDVMLNVRTS